MTQIFHLLEAKLALAELQGQVGLTQLCEDPSEMLEMFFPGRAVHNNIIDVCSRELPTVVEDFIHHLLEGSWSIMEPKRHNTKLKKSIWGGECSFLLRLLRHGDLPITSCKVKRGDESSRAYTLQHLVSPGHRVCGLHSPTPRQPGA